MYPEFEGWLKFSGRENQGFTYDPYPWSELVNILEKAEVKNLRDYTILSRKDKRLYWDPARYYPQWESWSMFSRKQRLNIFYSWSKTQRLLSFFKISSEESYETLRKEYIYLPEKPHIYYSEWPGSWKSFTKTNFHAWEKFLEILKLFNIKNLDDYLIIQIKDSKLPTNPILEYPQWEGWGLEYNTTARYSYKEFRQVVKKLRIDTKEQYITCYKEDPHLPSAPHIEYSEDWFNWPHALSKPLNSIHTSEFLKFKRISNFIDYQALSLSDESLVKDPVTEFNLDNFDELLSLRIYSAKEILKYCTRNEIYSANEYDKEHADKQAHLPRSYRAEGYNGWRSIVPEKPWFYGIPDKYKNWALDADEFIKTGKNIALRQSAFRSFFINYLDKFKQPTSPCLFFEIGRPPPPLDSWLKTSSSPEIEKKRLKIVVEFMTFLFKKHCCIVDNETSETIALEGFKNHFENKNIKLSKRDAKRASSTNKPALPLYYLRKLEKYLAPEHASSFRELTSTISFFNNEWFNVQKGKIDKDDPNCVFRQLPNGQYQMWSPVRALAILLLISTPYRGQQILWLDSGEADDEIPVIKNGKYIWVNNSHELVNDVNRKSNQEGFLRHLTEHDNTADGSGSIGSFINTNKTGHPFYVAWVPPRIIRWVILLRDWQVKYNSLKKLTSWLKINLTSPVNEDILRNRGHQAFLFRDPTLKDNDDTSSPISTRYMGTHLPRLLYLIQEEKYPLAEYIKGTNPDSILSYTSKFTPHAMRVSNITAMILDYDLPIAVVAKIVGHAQVLMTLYYTQISETNIRQQLTNMEERALAESTRRLDELVTNQEYKSAKSYLTSQDHALIDAVMVPSHPRASLIFKDYGICPYSNSKCDEGGYKFDHASRLYPPVERGYLGTSNCLQCRFFITGAPFLGGLTNLANEISLEMSEKAKKKSELDERLRQLEREQYKCEQNKDVFTSIGELYRVEAAAESYDKKLMALAVDLTSAMRFALKSKTLLNQPNSESKTQLLAAVDKSELTALIEEVGEFRQLTEVCRRSEFYISSEPDRAIPKRSLLIDKMMQQNNIVPIMCTLSTTEQLKVGNQITHLLRARLNEDWPLIEELIDGKFKFEDFGITEQDLSLEKLVGDTKIQVKSNSSLELHDDRIR